MKKILILLLSISTINSFAQNKITVKVAGGSTSSTISDNSRVSLKSMGILSDADLSFGSNSFGTDQTNAIQAILNTATATAPLNLIWDVRISTTGLKVKSNTTITVSQNCGAILRDNSDNFILYNNNWVGQSNAFVDSNITINGGIWNGNGYRSALAKQIHSNSSKGMITGFNFSGVKNIKLLNTSIINTRTYGLFVMTVEDLLIDRMDIYQGVVPIINQDGIDIIGYAKNITIQNSRISCGDDRIALAANGFGGIAGIGENHTPYTGVNGDQENIFIDNIYFYGTGKGFAFYCAGANEMKNIFVSNIFGTCETFWLGIFNWSIAPGYTITKGTKPIRNIVFENINVEVVGYNPYDLAGYSTVVIACSIDNLTFKNIVRTNYINNPTFGIYRPFGGNAIVINNLTIDNYNSINPTPANIVNQIIVNGATINRLNLINTNIDLGSTTRNAALINVQTGGVITSLSVSGRVNSLKNILNNTGTITSLNAFGITHTGQGEGVPSFLNTGTVSSAAFSNIITKQLTSGTFANSDSSSIIIY